MSDLPDHTKLVQITVAFPSANIDNPKKYEGTVTTAGVPEVLDVNTDLGKNAGDGYIVCDGNGDLLVSISKDSVTFEEDITVKKDEILDLSGMNIDCLLIDATEDGTAYRVVVL